MVPFNDANDAAARVTGAAALAAHAGIHLRNPPPVPTTDA
jgi:hypothetical protein